MATGTIWKTDDKYVVQFNEVRPKEKRIIFNNLHDWNQSGSGYHKDGTEIFLFSSNDNDEKKIFSLIKDMPFPFFEEKKSGKIKKIRTKHVVKTDLTGKGSRGKIGGGRSCSRCGAKGHNSRTCKT